MRKFTKIILILIIELVSLCLSTSCMFVGDNYKVRDLISYIDSNKKGNEKVQVVNLYDDYEQKKRGDLIRKCRHSNRSG